jgi:hypothetical protein
MRHVLAAVLLCGCLNPPFKPLFTIPDEGSQAVEERQKAQREADARIDAENLKARQEAEERAKVSRAKQLEASKARYAANTDRPCNGPNDPGPCTEDVADPETDWEATCLPSGKGGHVIASAGSWRIQIWADKIGTKVYVCEGRTSCERGGSEVLTPGMMFAHYDHPRILSCRSKIKAGIQVLEP